MWGKGKGKGWRKPGAKAKARLARGERYKASLL